jgi:hypothetical protein
MNQSDTAVYAPLVPKPLTRGRITPRSPTLQAELERIAEERLAAGREVEHAARWELARVCVECLASCLLGMLSIGVALHTTDLALGQIAFWGGMLIGTVGVFLSVLSAHRRGEQRGDW